MKRRQFIKNSALVVGAMVLPPFYYSCSAKKIDYLLSNCLIIDGSGSNGYKADLAIKDDKILGIGSFPAESAENIINLNFLTVTPGFIDIHSHTSTKLLINPKAESKITQGVTTEFYGMDGDSAAPMTEEMRNLWNESFQKKYGIEIDWKDLEGFYKAMTLRGHAVNFGTYIGQGTLRENVIGKSDRAATEEDIKNMQQLLEKSMAAGAWGVSSGLEYTPGSFATTEEIIKVISVLKGTSFPYTTHMRNEGDTLLEAVDEAIQIADGAGIPLHISHLKVEGKRNWHKTDDLFNKINSTNTKITFDRYPYIAYSTGLANLFPLWAREGGSQKFISRLENKADLQKIKSYTMGKIEMLGSWDAVMISSVESENNKELQGKRVSEIAKIWGESEFDCAVRLIKEENNRVGMVGFGMSEENTARIISHPKCVVASDGSALATHGPLSEGNPHPRRRLQGPRDEGVDHGPGGGSQRPAGMGAHSPRMKLRPPAPARLVRPAAGTSARSRRRAGAR